MNEQPTSELEQLELEFRHSVLSALAEFGRRCELADMQPLDQFRVTQGAACDLLVSIYTLMAVLRPDFDLERTLGNFSVVVRAGVREALAIFAANRS